MGNSILKGISAALGVTVITLFAGLIWTALEVGGLSTGTLVDIGLVASCIAAGYVTGRESGQWVLGGVSGLGYVLFCVILVALFLELRAWGVIQVLAEGGLIGILSGAFGAGSGGKSSRPAGWRNPNVSSWGNSYSSRGAYSSGEIYRGSYDYSRTYKDEDDHGNDWDDLLGEDWEASYEEPAVKGNRARKESRWGEKQKTDMDLWEEEQERSRKGKLSKQLGLSFDRQAGTDEDEWEDWLQGEKNKSSSNYRKAWWEEEVL
ncbi:MAG TPA: TIGR04086 family membrane protein [Desulfitobacterium dehalogenans]|uniref:TIGR04086 family membrane protein n=1 Tax=Desulfitobacterium dehalogenans TaxID=36854 RepID=A0A7C6Z5K5_9FIRM|nr:TIGR04086 family membrane protein [Desulfitobacterium dehalogenans]